MQRSRLTTAVAASMIKTETQNILDVLKARRRAVLRTRSRPRRTPSTRLPRLNVSSA
jgi:hypothetical protein